MAKKSSKYTRARIRAHGRKRQRRGGTTWFYGAIALIVIAFLVIGFFTISDRSSADTPPQPGNPSTGEPGDHWHAAIAANVCGEWLSNPATFETAADNPNVRVGIHTHGDGFMHIHPFTKSEGGDNATVGRFLTDGGWSASEGELSLWAGPAADPQQTDWSDGDKCPPGTEFAGQKGVVKWAIDCKERQGNPSDYKPQNGDVVAFGFLPKSEPIPTPPNASAAPEDDGGSTTPLDNKGCVTAGPGAETATTTVAGATPDTTVAGATPDTTVATTPTS
jgi:hypothetical protein